MIRRSRKGLALVLGWLVFPIAPVVLESSYYASTCFDPFNSSSLDPYDWKWGH
jgi:hypothetical protein